MTRKFLILLLLIFASNSLLFAEGLNGFVESNFSPRVSENPFFKNDDYVSAESRLQLSYQHFGEIGETFFKMDFINDQVKDTTIIELREANIKFSPFEFMDVKAGRQILTWGVGDLVFVNDIFPKDWNSFFSGRGVEYLKAPNDAVKFSFFNNFANLDFVFIPTFEADRLPETERFSYWNGQSLSNSSLTIKKPEKTFGNQEYSFRLSKRLFNYKTSLYYYRGFWKTPKGQTATFTGFYPELDVYGASFRGQLLGGIFAGEFGYYNSREDKNGDNAFVENSSYRYLVNFEKEIVADLTGNIQYYSEIIKNFDENTQAKGREEFRYLVTTRLTKRLFYETLTLSFFAFYSPSEKDFYLRPEATYGFSDNLKLSVLGSIFGGKESFTMFGQNEDNSNVSLRLRYSF
ncbi:MAG: hypothetical protein DWQ06_04670 [Calditrichaeota bacterium]|nr:MAG: hypothetical protein DWQ06_04670 [Calditrichota bacterium]